MANGRSSDATEDVAKKITLRSTDSDGDGLTFKISDAPDHGDLGRISEVSCAGAIPESCFAEVLYNPDYDFNGADSFGFRVSDGTASSEEATVQVSVKAANDAPVGEDDRAKVCKDERVRLNVLKNDSDPEGDPLAIKGFTEGGHGDVRCSTEGRCVYAPDRGFLSRDTFTYKVKDGRGGTNVANVRIGIGPKR